MVNFATSQFIDCVNIFIIHNYLNSYLMVIAYFLVSMLKDSLKEFVSTFGIDGENKTETTWQKRQQRLTEDWAEFREAIQGAAIAKYASTRSQCSLCNRHGYLIRCVNITRIVFSVSLQYFQIYAS